MRDGKLTAEDLKNLAAPFDEATVRAKVQAINRDKSRALMVAYVSHTDVADRLDAVDPTWSFEVRSACMSEHLVVKRGGDLVAEPVFICEGSLIIKGVRRDNAGAGNNAKNAYSDALKRCAMLFGVARDLYSQKKAWIDWDDAKDRFRAWTMAMVRERASDGMEEEKDVPGAETPAAAPTGGGESSDGRTQEAAQELGAMLLEMSNDDQEQAGKLLEHLTTFIGDYGKQVDGVASVKALVKLRNREGKATRFWRAYWHVKKDIHPAWKAQVERDESVRALPLLQWIEALEFGGDET